MRLLSHLRITLVGFLMGCADVVPGVSGGTIAFICGIYDRLIDGIKSIDVTTLRLALKFDFKGVFTRVPVLFFAFLGGGLLLAIFTAARVLSHLMQTHPVALWSFFFGLVLGSIILLARITWKWRPLDWTLFIAFGLATFWLVGLEATQTPATLPFIFLSGAIAICAMILPGISGSYLLVILGKYQQILDAVNQRDFVTLAVFCAGIATGILSFVRVVSWLLHTYRHATLVALTGVMAGALRTLWPWKEVIATRVNSKGVEVPMTQINVMPSDMNQVLVAIGLAVVGGLAVILIERIAAAERRESRG
jgi:putative membrane protein